MSTRAAILAEARQQLKNKDVPAQERERLLNLLRQLISGMGENVLKNDDFSTLLLETVLNNGNLVTILERQAAELEALKRITRNLTATLDLQVVLDQVVQEAMYLIKDSSDVHIYLYQEDKLVFGASLDTEGTKNREISVPRPEGLSFAVAHGKQIIIVEDLQTHPLFINNPANWKGSIIGIPLIMEESVVGIMNLARSRTGEFKQPEIRLLGMLADQAAIAIHNANLHQAVSLQARSDTITCLPNRRALDEYLDFAIRHSAHTGSPFSVVMLDLDGFKLVNDRFGHDVGDDVLRQVAEALKKTLRTSDFLARYGGDEMTLVLIDTDLRQSRVVTRKLQEQLRDMEFRLPKQQTTRISVSGGIAIYPKHAGTAPGLLRAADEALYHAKNQPRGGIEPSKSRGKEALRSSGSRS